MRPPFDVVVFDLDGTLADTSADLAAALNHALGRIGRPSLGLAQVRGMIGNGTRALMRRGLAATGAVDEALVERSLPDLVAFYAANICRETTAALGADDALAALKARGVRLAICTNKPEHLTRLLVDALGWSGSFDAIVGGDTLSTQKPNAAPLLEAVARAGGGAALFVGDSLVDAYTARAARKPFVAVDFGFRDCPIEALKADHIISDFRDLIGLMERMGHPSENVRFPESRNG